MAKFFPRYAKKADVPQALASYFAPLDPAQPDGEHVFDGLEPDAKGYAFANVSALTNERDELRRVSERRNTQLQSYRKNRTDAKSELWSDAEIDALVADRAALESLRGKQVDVTELRKQVAAELNAQFQQKETASKKQFDSEKQRGDFYLKKYQQVLREKTAAKALVGLTPQEGLEDIAVRTFMDEIDFEEVAPDETKQRPFPEYEPRVKGATGWRLDGKGAPLSADEYARGEFVKSRGAMFKPLKPSQGNGIKSSDGGGAGGTGGAQGAAGKPGSGQYVFKLTGGAVDSNEYQKALKATPKSDHLHTVDAQGNFLRATPGAGG